MKQGLLKFFKRIEPSKDKAFLHTLYDGLFTFAFTPNHVTKNGVHIRDGMDLKRTMVYVVLALQLCYIFGTYNIGHQHFLAAGEHTSFLSGFHLKLVYGLIQIIPIFVITHLVGLGIEFFYASKKGHPIEEGFLVSGALIPLIMPPDIPLWILTLAIIFAVIIGKEAFGGTGMNVLNVALLARVFIFFAYPTAISGDEVWVAGFNSLTPGSPVDYGWIHTSVFNPIFEAAGWSLFDVKAAVVDGYTGATPLSLSYKGGWENVTNVYSSSQMIWGTIPGSIGETSKVMVVLGMLFLMITRVADWKIIVSSLFGAAVMGLILNGIANPNVPFMSIPWYDHFIMGSLLFAIAFMATDPVTAAQTTIGKYIYGFLIGILGIIIRAMNPAYPEGWMLAILFMNVFAPLIDHYVMESNIKKRLARAKAKV